MEPMETPHAIALKDLLAKAQDKISIKELRQRLQGLIEGERSQQEVNDYRLHRGTVKKLTDELFPVSRLFAYRRITRGFVSFPLDSKWPDAWWHRGKNRVGIEVTISQGRARNILGQELVNATGAVRGYLGLQDDAKPREVKAAKKSERAMYATDEPLGTVARGILHCLKRKNAKKYEDMILVIEAPLLLLASDRWKPLVPTLKKAAKGLPFVEVYVLGRSDKLVGLKIK